MHALQMIKGLGPIDAKSIRRDSMLRWLIVLPIFLALMTRWVFPMVIAGLGRAINLDLIAFYPVIMTYVLLMIAPMITGMVIGFVLLDQRDDQTLTALQVTPLPMPLYLAYRLITPMLLSIGLTILAIPAAGLLDVSFRALVLVALVAAPLASVYALALAAFAANKVQGLALLKASGLVQIAPLVAYFVPSQWQWLFGIMPTYWPAKLYWTIQAGEPYFWAYALVGGGFYALLLAALLRRFNTVTHR